MPVKLASLLPGGGNASEVQVQVVRSYPVVYKGASARFVNEKFHDSLSRLRGVDREKEVEEIVARVQKEYEAKQRMRPLQQGPAASGGHKKLPTAAQIRRLNTGEEIWEAVEAAPDPDSVESALTNLQVQVLGRNLK